LKYVLVFIVSLLFNTDVCSQSIDSTIWNFFADSSLSISFKYPSFFKIKIVKENNESCYSLVHLHYMFYEAIELNESSNSDSLECPSGLTISLCNKDFYYIAKEYGFYEKNGLWYGDIDYVPQDENSEWSELYTGVAIYFDEWTGIKVISPTSVYLKRGGCFTAAGEHYRFVLSKKIDNEKFLFAKGWGFSFPQADKILIEICKSIKIIRSNVK